MTRVAIAWALALCAAGLAEAAVVRSNETFAVTWDERDGTLSSLVLSGDPDKMNWIEGTDRWGAIRLHRMERKRGGDTWGDTTRMAFAGLREDGAAVVSTYRLGPMRAEVRREVTDGGLEEAYAFTNEATYPVYFLRGYLGILATFNDSYAPASASETKRCHAHVWCGGENSWVRALKMGPCPTELALVLRQGDLDAYSVRRIAAESSNDRGDFVLHPAPFHLKPGETKTIAWRVAAYPAGKFDETLLRNGGAKISFRQETIFPDETFEIDVTGPDGETRHHSRKPDRGAGVYDFAFDVGGRIAKAHGYCSPAFADLVAARVRFIVRKQQCLEPDSPLYGAYLVWDSQDDAPYFDYLWRDHNACRERVAMALTVARWLRRNPDPEALRSLELFEAFALREFFDEKTCTVYDTVGKDPKHKRLYNAPNLVQLWRELYALKKDARYLDYIEKSIMDYYRLGGAKFYPNGCDFSSELVLLEKAGRRLPELREAVRRHVANIAANGIRYPEHEVRFEQTIATPAVSMLAQYYRLVEKSPSVRAALEANFDVLSRFQGNQPDHKLYETAIRHWDGYWFGKDHLFGDTLHQHSAITARAFLQYAAATGDRRPVARAEHCLRNCLYLFRPDGAATCAYLLPLTVTMLNGDGSVARAARRGECADPFVNDMDSALYLAMRSGLFGAYGETDMPSVDEAARERIAAIRATPNMAIPEGAPCFYVSERKGDDAADGRSPQTAWKTLARLKQADVPSGAFVLFERGGVYRGSVKACRGVTYSAYGAGAKPVVCGSPEDGAVAARWRQTDNPKVWAYEIGRRDVGTLVFDGGAAHAAKVLIRTDAKTGRKTDKRTGLPFDSYRDLVRDLDFWHDYYEHGTGLLYLCSERNPGERFESIEFCVGCNGFGVGDRSGVTIDNIAVKYVGRHGVAAATCRNLTVSNCEFAWIGGSIQGENLFGRDHPTRLGNGVEIWGGCDGFVVTNCYLHDVYDAAVTHQFDLPDKDGVRRCDQRNVRFSGNVIERSNYGIEYFLRVPKGNPSAIENVVYADNLMLGIGEGFCAQRPDRGGAAAVKTWNSVRNSPTRNFVIRNSGETPHGK